MNTDIEQYNAQLPLAYQALCNRLMQEIDRQLANAECKRWHGSPVWFIQGNPIVGYSMLKNSVQLLFWSGASFEENLQPVVKFMAAEMRYTQESQIDSEALTRWLTKAKTIQWDYKNVVKQQGKLERLG